MAIEDSKSQMMASSEKVMVNGRFKSPQPPFAMVEIARGMKIYDADGTELGLVGGVMVHSLREEVSHILLCQLPVAADYRLIPVHLIARIDEEVVYLTMQREDLKTLAVHQPV